MFTLLHAYRQVAEGQLLQWIAGSGWSLFCGQRWALTDREFGSEVSYRGHGDSEVGRGVDKGEFQRKYCDWRW